MGGSSRAVLNTPQRGTSRCRRRSRPQHHKQTLSESYGVGSTVSWRTEFRLIHPGVSDEEAAAYHAFGLELLRKWPSGLGRTPPWKVFDQTASRLEKFDLFHCQNLYEPALELAPVLRAISRCKDELVSPADYARAAADYKGAAPSEEDHEAADKMQEFADIYEVYEDALLRANAVDFGDLIRLAIEARNRSDRLLLGGGVLVSSRQLSGRAGRSFLHVLPSLFA